ncbi:MAG TPA: prepilin-type N-terminal cleavage/methylation domain-containing protein [Candidatus Limnocylindrales bacterium]|nr:prepilin-type N-terminal cleavage/methylation domain-containing protein [Candidatus Limnocylindrales bacterium]
MLMKLRKNEHGFTLIELLIVVAIIGIIAAIAIPNLLDATQRAKQRRTMGDMKTIANAVGQYMQDASIAIQYSGNPAASGSAFISSLVPTYIAAIPDQDGWGNTFVYTTTAKDAYTLISPGRDGAINTPSTRNDRNWDHDLMISNGIFIASPDSGT